MSQRFVPAALSGLALVAGAPGCTASGGSGGAVERFLFTDPEAGIVSEPLRLGPTVIGDDGEAVISAEWTGSSPLLQRVGLFAGLEGAPVLDGKGNLRGMLEADALGLKRFGDGSSTRVPIASAADMQLDIERGRILGHPLDGCLPIPGNIDDLQPGSAVALVRWWGPIEGADHGTIAWRVGNEVYGAASDGYPGTRLPGPMLLALARVRVTGFGTGGQWGGWKRVDSLGDIVGTVAYEGAGGSYAVLGVSPPLFSVAIDVELDGERIEEDRFTVVGDPRLWREWVARILSGVLGQRLGLSGASARLLVEVDGGAAVSVEVTMGRGTTAGQAALAHLGADVPRSVRITLLLR